jgi:hypothetical protein
MKQLGVFHLIGILFSLAAAAALARDPIPIVDQMPNKSDIPPDEIKEYEWKEGKVKIPPYPDDGDLLEFYVDGANPNFRYFLDENSLSIGESDNVARYTLVVKSKTGARNVFYEGIRCNTEEYKTYAFGVGKNKMKPMRDPQWRPIQNFRHTKHRLDLLNFYLCSASRPRHPEAAVSAIKHPIQQQTSQDPGHNLYGR